MADEITAAEGQPPADNGGQENQAVSILAGKTFKSMGADGKNIVERYDEKGVLIEEKPEEAGKDAGKQPEKKDDSGKGERPEPPVEDPEGKKADGDPGPDADENLIDPNDPKGVITRINKALNKRDVAELKAARLEGELSALKERLAAVEGGAKKSDSEDKKHGEASKPADGGKPVRPVRPKEDDFSNLDEYEQARDKYVDDIADYSENLADWKSQQAVKDYAASQQEQAAEAESQKWVSEGVKKFPDFKEVAMSDSTLNLYTDVMLDAVNASDKSQELAYHLGKNPAEVRRIAALPLIRQVVEITKIDFELQGKQRQQSKPDNNQPDKTEKPGIKRTTSVDDPIKPLTGPGTAGAFDPAKASPAEIKERLDNRALAQIRQQRV